MENLNKTIDWDIALSWNRTFGLYHLNMNAGGTWYRMDSPWVDDNMKFKPLFYASATHTFSFGAKVKAVLYMYYQTSYDYYNMYVSQMYNLSPYLSISLLKNKLNVQVGGKCLINHGDEYSREQYAHTLSINNTNPHYRTLTIGITYNLNNFIDLFKPNETGEEMIKRAY